MTGYDAQKGELLSIADDIYAVGVTDGRAAQQIADQAAIDGLNATISTLQADETVDEATITDLTAKVAALQAELDAQNPPPPPPPPPPANTPLFGANFGSNPDQSLYPAAVPVARVFPSSGYPSDLSSMAAVKQAVAKKAKAIILDFPTSMTDAQVTATVKQGVALGFEVLAGGTHEPEHNDKLSPAAWVAQNVHLSPIIRAAGGKVVPILQSATVAMDGKGRTLSAYNLPKGTAAYAGFDLYPTTQVIPQDQLLPKLVAASQSVFGCDLIVFGEYGVPAGNVALIKAFKTWAATHVYRAAYWSQTPYVLDSPGATAWFA